MIGACPRRDAGARSGMTGSDNNDGPAVLLLNRSPCWTEAVQSEAAGLRLSRLQSVAHGRDALELLCGGQRFSHLLLHPPAADELLPDLLGLTCGEAESGIATVLLGTDGAAAQLLPGGGRARRVDRASAGWLARVLAPAPARPAFPDLPAEDLLAAVIAGQLQIRYQPLVRIADGVPFGLEALARLEHPRLGTLPPSRFVPQIEAAGFASRLAEAAVSRAFGDWRGDVLGRLGLRLGVNLPLDVLVQPGLTDRLEAWREQAGIDPGRIAVELTETHPIGSRDQLAVVLERLHAAGYGLAMDDVGPGLRDHEELAGLPFTALKLDIRVVRDSAHSDAARRFIARAVAAARDRGMMVIAEGVETEADWHRMAAFGVDAAQGFLIARPLTATAAAIWRTHWTGGQPA